MPIADIPHKQPDKQAFIKEQGMQHHPQHGVQIKPSVTIIHMLVQAIKAVYSP
jgi:hypothetical protein